MKSMFVVVMRMTALLLFVSIASSTVDAVDCLDKNGVAVCTLHDPFELEAMMQPFVYLHLTIDDGGSERALQHFCYQFDCANLKSMGLLIVFNCQCSSFGHNCDAQLFCRSNLPPPPPPCPVTPPCPIVPPTPEKPSPPITCEQTSWEKIDFFIGLLITLAGLIAYVYQRIKRWQNGEECALPAFCHNGLCDDDASEDDFDDDRRRRFEMNETDKEYDDDSQLKTNKEEEEEDGDDGKDKKEEDGNKKTAAYNNEAVALTIEEE